MNEPVTQAIRFQGQYADAETGLHYNRFRYYDPDAARYISLDPIGLNGGENLYQYGRNPVGFIDPLGLASCNWETAKKEYWKDKASKELTAPSGKYSPNNIREILAGKAPRFESIVVDRKGNGAQLTKDIPIELHHVYIPQRDNFK